MVYIMTSCGSFQHLDITESYRKLPPYNPSKIQKTQATGSFWIPRIEASLLGSWTFSLCCYTQLSVIVPPRDCLPQVFNSKYRSSNVLTAFKTYCLFPVLKTRRKKIGCKNISNFPRLCRSRFDTQHQNKHSHLCRVRILSFAIKKYADN